MVVKRLAVEEVGDTEMRNVGPELSKSDVKDVGNRELEEAAAVCMDVTFMTPADESVTRSCRDNERIGGDLKV